MNILLIDQKWTTRDLLIRKLFPRGITVFHAETLEEGTEIMNNHKISVLVIDIDFSPENCLSYLVTLGKLQIKPVRVIVSSIGDKNAIMEFVKTGIAGYIMKPFSEESGFPRLWEIIARITPRDEKRTFFRVTPKEGEEKKVFFRLTSNTKLQSATLINLSAGGLALHAAAEIPDSEMPTGTFIPKVQMRLQNQEIYLAGDVIYKKGPVFAMKLRNCSEHDLFVLSKYIFNKIAEMH